MTETFNRNIAVLVARLLLGLIFLMQGFGKVFSIGVGNIYDSYFKDTYQDLLPSFLTVATAYYTSFVELICGLLLVVGFKRDLALYLLATVLVIVTFGHGLASPVWDLSHVFFRAILLIFLLMTPKSFDKFSFDYLLKSKANHS